MRRRAPWICVIVLLLGQGAGAQVRAVIPFDDIPGGFGSYGHLREQYAHLGIHFKDHNGIIKGGMSAGDPGNWDLEGTNGPAFLGFNGPYSLAATFDVPAIELSLDVSRSNGSSPGNTFTLKGFDQGVLVDTQTVTLGPVNDWTTVSLLAGGMDRIEWFGSGGGFHPYGVDNLTFLPIPEPATLGLLAAGCLGLRRRRKHAFS